MVPESPAHGGRAWAEASSQHFRVIADLPAEDAAAMALELEQALDAIDQVAFEHARAALELTTVVVFSDSSDFHAFAPELVEGRFYRQLPGDLESSRFMLLHGTLSTRSRVACLHELVHDLFEGNFGPAPPRLNEGWAQYYGELLRLDRNQFYESSTREQPDDATRLRSTSLYLGSWALVHMLRDGPESYPTRFKQFLQNVRGDRVENAWRAAFAGGSDAEFDRDFRHYVALRQLAVFELGKRNASYWAAQFPDRVLQCRATRRRQHRDYGVASRTAS